MNQKYKKNSQVSYNQLRVKFLYNNTFESNTDINMHLNINLFKLKSFNDDTLLESLFLLEFFSSLKSYISYHKKMFQEVNVQVANTLRKDSLMYFLVLLRTFYFPILYRRNFSFDDLKFINKSFNFNISNVNLLPFLPDTFFKWRTPLNLSINFTTSDLKKNKILLEYYGFSF